MNLCTDLIGDGRLIRASRLRRRLRGSYLRPSRV